MLLLYYALYKSNELKKILPWENQRVNIAPDITVTNE